MFMYVKLATQILTRQSHIRFSMHSHIYFVEHRIESEYVQHDHIEES
jgi:hypothetical protein